MLQEVSNFGHNYFKKTNKPTENTTTHMTPPVHNKATDRNSSLIRPNYRLLTDSFTNNIIFHVVIVRKLPAGM